MLNHRITFPAGFFSLCILMGSLWLAGCTGREFNPKPKHLISERNYIDLLVEMQHITTWKNARPDSVNVDSLKQLIYDKYHITEAQFLASHKYYQKDLDRQLERVDEAIRQLKNEENYIQQHIDSVKKEEQLSDSLSQAKTSSD
jgi:gas vesicle protein